MIRVVKQIRECFLDIGALFIPIFMWISLGVFLYLWICKIQQNLGVQ